MLHHETAPRLANLQRIEEATEAIRPASGINGMEMDEFPRASVSAEPRDSGNELDTMEELHRRTVRKLDLLLLPFLALLFLFNSLDRSNIGNAETANFTKDLGLAPEDLNTAVAVFFTFFVALQPVGAALGRKFGMKIWVPACMSLWGLATCATVWVGSKWQLIILRAFIGTLEAGFYPTTVAYMSLFYTRYEFGRRLSLFYGQYAVAGALGGLLAYGVFSKFPSPEEGNNLNRWKSWQMLFLLEGGVTMLLAAIGFLWLPQSAGSAWFLKADERIWAERRIQLDIHGPSLGRSKAMAGDTVEEDRFQDEEGRGLLSGTSSSSSSGRKLATDARGLSKRDVLEAVLDWKLWYLLACNILSAIPATAFSVFLPLVLRNMTSSPAYANLLLVPPYIFGALVLYAFSHWSDRSKQRMVPILWSLGLVMAGLSGVVLIPSTLGGPRYLSLCVLLGGTFVASPLTIAWFSGNLPEAGKRSLVLGINGWGNVAGVIASVIFHPRYGPSYTLSFSITLVLVGVSFAGYALFRRLLVAENERRMAVLDSWTDSEIEDETTAGRGPLTKKTPLALRALGRVLGQTRVGWMAEALGDERRGDEKLTFVHTL